MRIAALISHPVQYYAPIFRCLATRCDLQVFYGQELTPRQQGAAGFGTEFAWDVDLLSGYSSKFLTNVSYRPGADRFFGCDTPEISNYLRHGSFDALLVAGWYLKSHIQAIFAARQLGIPVMVRGDSHLDTPRSTPKKILKELLQPRLLRWFDAALFVGEKSRAFYEHYRYPQNRLFFSPHCVDTEWFAARATEKARAALRQAHGIRDDTHVALFAGRLVDFKRPLDVIVAAANCRAGGRDVEVMIAGSGQLEARLVIEADRLRVPLHLLGFCNQSKMPEAYAAADMLVLPSSGYETWGLVANEALACARPIIVSDACGCAPDLAADGRAGRMVPVGDIAALAGSMSDLIDIPCAEADIAERSAKYSVAAAVDGVLQAAQMFKVDSVKRSLQP
jgi:glycosyltransferase involved in cell wall biosynthesis